MKWFKNFTEVLTNSSRDSPGFLLTAVELSQEQKDREKAERSMALATLYSCVCMWL